MLESLPSGWKISSKTFPFSASQSTCSFLWDEVPQSYVWDKKTWVSAQTSDCCLKNLNRIWSNIGRGEKKLKCLKTDVNLNSDDKLNHPLGAKCKNQNASIDIINIYIYIYTCIYIYIYTSTPVYYIYIYTYTIPWCSTPPAQIKVINVTAGFHRTCATGPAVRLPGSREKHSQVQPQVTWQ